MLYRKNVQTVVEGGRKVSKLSRNINDFVKLNFSTFYPEVYLL